LPITWHGALPLGIIRNRLQAIATVLDTVGNRVGTQLCHSVLSLRFEHLPSRSTYGRSVHKVLTRRRAGGRQAGRSLGKAASAVRNIVAYP
jgi:hypothetical protein